jgi:hypothetical protein
VLRTFTVQASINTNLNTVTVWRNELMDLCPLNIRILPLSMFFNRCIAPNVISPEELINTEKLGTYFHENVRHYRCHLHLI